MYLSYLAEISREGAVFAHRVFTVAVNFLQKVDHCGGEGWTLCNCIYYIIFSKDLHLILFANPALPPPPYEDSLMITHCGNAVFDKSLKSYMCFNNWNPYSLRLRSITKAYTQRCWTETMTISHVKTRPLRKFNEH